MGIFAVWLSEHWAIFLQSVGVVGGLVFTGYNLRQNARIKRIDTLIQLTAQHRSIWLKYLDSPALKGVLRENRDIAEEPPTDEETIFVNLATLHLWTSIAAARSGIFPEFAGQERDIEEFFKLPVPRAVWENTKEFRDPAMVRYVEGLLRGEARSG